jgi:hypothetical protein
MILRATVALLLALTASGAAMGQAADHEDALTLRIIMGELGAEFLGLTDAVLRDDYERVAAAARAIAGHPLPDPVVADIQAELGPDFAPFEEIDLASHDAAEALATAGTQGDALAVVDGTGALLSTFAECHLHFRARLRPISD